MSKRIVQVLTCACLTVCLAACGGSNEDTPRASVLAPAEVRITAPEDGATVPANSPVSIKYEARLSPRGDHLHISVDGGPPDVVKQLKGSHTIGPLPPGRHTVTVTEVTPEHVPTGHDATINIVAK